MTIKRIKNLKLSTTPEQIRNEWNEIKSVRNRLLQNSDWIHLSDVGLEDSIIRLWVQWRTNVRSVDDIVDLSKALVFLKDLQDNTPPIKYKNTTPASVDFYKILLCKQLLQSIKTSVDAIAENMDSKEILFERFEEALRYMEGHIENNFLIELEALHTDSTLDEVAERFIEDRKNYFVKLINTERVKNQYYKRIEGLDNMEDCDKIRDELLILGSKKWI